jgi:type I restriction enzyme S subunit
MNLLEKTAIFEENGDFVFASYLMRIKIKKGIILPDYLNFYMNYSITQQRLKSLATRGVSQANISSGQLILFKIAYPPALEEQSQIAQILKHSDLKIAALEQELALYQELFRVLLEELMSGRLSVQPLLEQEQATDAAEGSMHRG